MFLRGSDIFEISVAKLAYDKEDQVDRIGIDSRLEKVEEFLATIDSIEEGLWYVAESIPEKKKIGRWIHWFWTKGFIKGIVDNVLLVSR